MNALEDNIIMDKIVIKNARENNLKGINIELP